jgi:heptaprenyl diphosphate synthase
VTASDLFSLPVDEADVARLEACLRESVLGEDPFLNEVASHLIEAGGKRLRPALALTAASLSSVAVSRETLLGGVCVELVHLASLYHDDVMDEATRRRSVESVNARWGNLVAIVAGDFLLARSAEIAASLGPEVAGLLAATLARLCQGQVSEVRAAFQIDRSEKDYLRAIANKTAALMSTACRVGAITAGLDRTQIDDVTAFGESFGMVFQIRDDVLDVIATEEELGKTPGQDLSEGIYTLPVQRALEDRVYGPRLRDLLGKPLSEHERDTARALVAASPGITASSDAAREFAEQAAEAAGRLGDNPVVTALSTLSIRVAEDLALTAGQARERFEALAG